MNRALREFDLELRVRYQETDGQGRVHHANYLTYFEQARVEQLRAAGFSYRGLEESGRLLVVAHVELEYLFPAQYDDLLRVRVITERAKGARIIHRYEVSRDDVLLVRGRTTVACVDRDGKVRRLPDELRL